MADFIKDNLLKCFTVILVTVGVTIIAFTLFNIGIRPESILLLYILGVLIINLKTKNYVWGIISSTFSVFVFNFFFTEPIFSLKIDDHNYFIALVIFFLVSFIVCTLTINLQQQISCSVAAQKITDNLYKISTGYLTISGIENIIRYGVTSLNLLYPCHYYLFTESEVNDKLYIYDNFGAVSEESLDPKLLESVFELLENNSFREPDFINLENVEWCFLPIISNGELLGVLSVQKSPDELEKSDLRMIQSIISQIAVVIDRENAYASEHKSRILSEREKLRSSLLRSISHDLRTPLAGITGSVSFLIESYQMIDDKSRNSLLNDILEDSVWLSNMVDNLLNMTRIQEDGLIIHKENEVVEDIISETVARVQKRIGSRKLEVAVSEELVEVPMDGQLIIQVLINLIDNSMKHTNSDGNIKLSVEFLRNGENAKNNYAKFTVTDNGTGIDKSLLLNIFEDFVTLNYNKADGKRGIGLGLSISKTIVTAHDGMIDAYNNPDQGATIYFLLPM